MVTADEVHYEHINTTVCPKCAHNGALIAVRGIGLARECQMCGIVFKYILD